MSVGAETNHQGVVELQFLAPAAVGENWHAQLLVVRAPARGAFDCGGDRQSVVVAERLAHGLGVGESDSDQNRSRPLGPRSSSTIGWHHAASAEASLRQPPLPQTTAEIRPGEMEATPSANLCACRESLHRCRRQGLCVQHGDEIGSNLVSVVVG